MSKPSALLDEPLSMGQETIPRATLFAGKAFLLFPFLIGFVFAVYVSPALFTRSDVEQVSINMRASPMSGISCHQVPAISVNAMQNTLRKNGVPFDPMEKFALTSFAAQRDPSMRAQAKEEFSKLDHVTQAKLTKLSKDVVVRAGAFNVEDQPGITAPLGFFDPAGFTNDITESRFNAYRRAEIKHGRVCMQASLGMIVSEKFHPIFDAWGDGPFVSAMASHFTETAAKNFWPAFWIMTAGHELATSFVDYEGKEVFDYGFDPLNLRPRDDPEKFLEYTNQELNHGRWAMICAPGIIAQELVTGQPVIS